MSAFGGKADIGCARYIVYRFAKRGRRFGSDVKLMIVYGAAIAHYGFGTPVRALPISRYLEMPRETVRRQPERGARWVSSARRDLCGATSSLLRPLSHLLPQYSGRCRFVLEYSPLPSHSK